MSDIGWTASNVTPGIYSSTRTQADSPDGVIILEDENEGVKGAFIIAHRMETEEICNAESLLFL
jgi:hypothetical protein